MYHGANACRVVGNSLITASLSDMSKSVRSVCGNFPSIRRTKDCMRSKKKIDMLERESHILIKIIILGLILIFTREFN